MALGLWSAGLGNCSVTLSRLGGHLRENIDGAGKNVGDLRRKVGGLRKKVGGLREKVGGVQADFRDVLGAGMTKRLILLEALSGHITRGRARWVRGNPDVGPMW